MAKYTPQQRAHKAADKKNLNSNDHNNDNQDVDHKKTKRGRVVEGASPLSLAIFTFFLGAFILVTVKGSRSFFSFNSYLTHADVIDTFNPYFVIFSYFYLFFKAKENEIIDLLNGKKTSKLLIFEIIVYTVFAIAWISGHGIHLASNSIHNLLDRKYFSYMNEDREHYMELLKDLEYLVDFWDERISHWVWHFGIEGMQAMLVLYGKGNTINSFLDAIVVIVSSTIYGLIFVGATIEGNTCHFGILYSFVLTVIMLAMNSFSTIRRCAILLFFFLAQTITLVLTLSWGAFTNWEFKEFSKMGIFFSKQ